MICKATFSKSVNKVLSILMVIVLIVGILPFKGSTNHIKAETNDSSISQPEENVFIQMNGENVESISMGIDERIILTSYSELEGDLSYSWEILIDESINKWAPIYKCNEVSLSVSYGMLSNFINEKGISRIRCVITLAEDIYISNSILIEVTSDNCKEKDLKSGSAYGMRRSLTSVNPKSIETDIVTLTINYIKDTGENICDPYIATIHKGMHFKTTVLSPIVAGYEPKFNETDTILAKAYEFDFDKVEEDVIVNIYYYPTEVKYEVRYYMQGIYDDEYTMDGHPIVAYGKVGSDPDMEYVEAKFEGFTEVNYQADPIAADGSSIYQCFYDREYYLVDLDLDGGHGVESVYAKYGTAFVVNNPKKAGWVFAGWDVDGNGDADEMVGTIPSRNISYKALWEAVETTYTKVYWRENADDGGYSYWGSTTHEAVSASVVSGSDDVPTSVSTATVGGKQVNEKVYFTYNNYLTDKNVVIEGDGSTIVNIYYTRNVYNIYFRGIRDTCKLEEHSHGVDCEYKYLCGYGDHVHTTACMSCELENHEHDYSCCIYPEHKHSDDCGCSYTGHVHSGDCCSLNACNNHGVDCYTIIETNGVVFSFSNRVTSSSTLNTLNRSEKDSNNIVTINNLFWKNYYYYDSNYDYWYSLSLESGTYNSSSVIVFDTTCHYHGDDDCNRDNCPYGYAHEHSDESCNCGFINHEHSETCDFSDCDKHIHTIECYGNCSSGGHTHVDACYGSCVKLEHKHNNTCTSNSTSNVVYSIRAKYDQTIGYIWATADRFPNTNLSGWSIDGVSNTSVSKRINMTSDLCDTSDRLKYASPTTGGSKTYLHYMFESFDQESDVDGNNRKYYKNKYYDIDPLYYQEVISSGTFSQKEIMGMTAVSNGVVTSGSNVFLYYNRNVHSIQFQNISNVVKTESNVLYGQPLNNYKGDDGELLSSYIPDYPDTYEPNAYYFDGWYTTPECFPGTEVDFSNVCMPNDDLILYASWKPVTHTVTFYNTYQDMENGSSLKSVDVLHGEVVESQSIPETKNEGYTAGEWFYIKNGERVAYRPISIPVTRDLEVYRDWSSDTIIEYNVHYYKVGTTEKVAESSHGWMFEGSTKTFKAKGGGDLSELYEEYSDGWYPLLSSTSIVADKNHSNTVIFYYDYQNPNPYKVRYLDSETGLEIEETKVVLDNYSSVVSEVYKPINGYMPDAYYKQLVLALNKMGSADYDEDKNVITFYYTKASNSAYYAVEYYFMNTDGKTYQLEAKIQSPILVGSYANIPEISTDGYLFEKCLARDGNQSSFREVSEGSMDRITVNKNGALIQVYYEREKTSYKVQYYITGTTNSLKEEKVVGGVYFGTIVEESSEDRIGNYSLVGESSQIKELVLDPTYNVFTFYYDEAVKTARYQAVVRDSDLADVNFGYVSHTQDVKKWSQTYDTVEATEMDRFYFVGWYADEELTELVSTDSSITPDSNEDITYYALFEPYYTDLTITKDVDDLLNRQSFVFNVVGLEDINDHIDVTVVINGEGSIDICHLPLGSYSISEKTDWSWKYDIVGQSYQEIEVVLDSNANKVYFENSRNDKNWLKGDNYERNIFN